jgi:ABC-type thiamine transport system ATPase subunit
MPRTSASRVSPDSNCRVSMLQLVRSVCEARSIALLMVSHSLEDAQQIAPRSVVSHLLWQVFFE